MRRIWNSFLISFAMYSRIPVPHADWEKENMKYTMCFFPAIGAVVGLLLYIWGRVAAWLGFGSLMRAAGCVLLPVVVTGGIHLDGFLDTMDALSSHQPQERKIEILKDSHAGAFAVIMGCAYFTLALGAWSEIDPALYPALGIVFVLSRALSALALAVFPKANKKGSLALFSDAAQKKVLLVSLAVWIAGCAGILIVMDWRYALVILATAVVTFWYYHHMAMKEFGGTTGDIAGFFVQVMELACACTVMITQCVLLAVR